MIEKAWIGIDPGKKGSACLLTEKNLIFFIDWPRHDDENIVISSMEEWKKDFEIQQAVLERVSSMPKNGVKSMFTFGVNYGEWKGILACLKIPYLTLPPKTWQKGIVYNTDGICPKIRSFKGAKRLFPDAELIGKRGGILDGRSDSLLMAYRASKS